MVNRATFDFVDPRPLSGSWFEKRTSNVQRGEGKVEHVEVVVFCETFDKGNSISERIVRADKPQEDPVILAHPKEWAEYLGQPVVKAVEPEPEAPIKKSTKRSRE